MTCVRQNSGLTSDRSQPVYGAAHHLNEKDPRDGIHHDEQKLAITGNGGQNRHPAKEKHNSVHADKGEKAERRDQKEREKHEEGHERIDNELRRVVEGQIAAERWGGKMRQVDRAEEEHQYESVA